LEAIAQAIKERDWISAQNPFSRKKSLVFLRPTRFPFPIPLAIFGELTKKRLECDDVNSHQRL
jgi:hypothetical protein